MNKDIHRDPQSTNNTFDSRSLEVDYPTLLPLLKTGAQVLDVGCGTGAISKGIANFIGPKGHVTGIDTTRDFILSGQNSYKDTSNLTLIHCDLFNFQHDDKFDLIVSARTLQWLSNPVDALLKMKSLLKPGGQVSILDYNHEAIEWEPNPPESMRALYEAFLKWRSDAGMDNRIADHLADHFKAAGFHGIQTLNSDEHYLKGNSNFIERLGIWIKVAGLKQLTEEGYISEAQKVKAIDEYENWIRKDAKKMVMKLNEVRGKA